jgi:hypothetical protein
MIKDSDVSKLEATLYPSGRAWDYARGGKKQPSDAEYYTDGEGNVFVDGDGNTYVSVPAVYSDVNAVRVNLRNKFIASYYRKIDSILDQMYPDNPNFTQDDLENSERIYGIVPDPASTFQQRMTVLYAHIAKTGTVLYQWTAKHLQDILQLSGFNVWVHENRFIGQTVEEQVGIMNVGFANVGGGRQSQYPFVAPYPQGWTEICANNIRKEDDANLLDPSYGTSIGFANVGFTQCCSDEIIDPLGDYPYFIFIEGETHGEHAYVPAERMKTLRDLVLKNKEAHIVALFYIDNVLN